MRLPQSRSAGEAHPLRVSGGTETARDRAFNSATRGMDRLTLVAIAWAAGWESAPLPATATVAVTQLAQWACLTVTETCAAINRLAAAGEIEAGPGDRFTIPACEPR
jgi:hypothetical protein